MKKELLSILCIAAAVSVMSACTVTPALSGASSEMSEGSPTSSSSSSSTPSNTVSADVTDIDFSFTDRDLRNEYDENGATLIVLSESGASVSGKGASFNNGKVTITAEGTYILSGSGSGVSVTVSVGDSEKVQLVFDNLSLENQNSNAIYIQSADKVFITLKEGTQNYISDGSLYEISDGDTSIDAAVFSRADLTINGTGSLTVNGNYKHAVVSKDDLVIYSATLNVTSKKVGLNGKDCVKINNAAILISAGSDGIRSDNEEDETKGYVYIEGGTIDISAENDAIQAETVLKVSDAVITAKSGKGSSSLGVSSSESCKGLKAGGSIIISDGTFTLDSQDDCIHSKGNIVISGGTFKLSSSDDGIHADGEVSVSGGEITVLKSYEGIEGSKIDISGGSISVTASDDGLNAAGGNDSSSVNGRPGQGWFSSSTGEIVISGGYTVINAYGDGIDSNGSFTMSGGVVLVSGPTNSGNGAFDYDISGTVTGGTLVALGSSGMAQGFSQAENQGAILCSFNSQSAGTSFALCDESGNVIVSFTPPKAYQSAVITSAGIQSGNTYTVVTGAVVSGADSNGYAQNTSKTGGNTISTIEMTSNIYGSSGMGGGMGGGKNPGIGERPQGGFGKGNIPDRNDLTGSATPV